SRLYRFPSHTSQGTYTSGRKCISIFKIPSPRHASHLPPLTLKLKRPFLYPRIFASFVSANTSRISSNTPVYVAGFDLGVRPIGAWLISITLSICSRPNIFSCTPGRCFPLYKCLANDLYKISFTSVLFPEPETPVTAVIKPIGNLDRKSTRLNSSHVSISYAVFCLKEKN